MTKLYHLKQLLTFSLLPETRRALQKEIDAEKRTCPVCAASFAAPLGSVGQRKYCSRTCMLHAMALAHVEERREYSRRYMARRRAERRQKTERLPRQCRGCKAMFVSARKHQRYCGEDCPVRCARRKQYHQQYYQRKRVEAA
jgi:hypothetical protein